MDARRAGAGRAGWSHAGAALLAVLGSVAVSSHRASAPAPAPKPRPGTFEQSESERRWGATGTISPELRDELDRFERAARARAAEAVGLSPAERARIERARQSADARRGEIERAGGRGPLGGRALAKIQVSATEELAALTQAIGEGRAQALRHAERDAYRDLLAAHEDTPTASALRDFARRRMLFLRMGEPARDTTARR